MCGLCNQRCDGMSISDPKSWSSASPLNLAPHLQFHFPRMQLFRYLCLYSIMKLFLSEMKKLIHSQKATRKMGGKKRIADLGDLSEFDSISTIRTSNSFQMLTLSYSTHTQKRFNHFQSNIPMQGLLGELGFFFPKDEHHTPCSPSQPHHHEGGEGVRGHLIRLLSPACEEGTQ